jgi:hypothetical protein
VTTSSFVFLAVFLAANAYFAYRVSVLYRLAKATTGPAWGGNRLDRIPERISTFIANVIGQKAVLRKKSAGIMHAAIFWGFIIITLETTENFIYELHNGFSWDFLIGSTPYAILVAVQDTFTLFVLLGVLYAFYRRLIIRPEGPWKIKRRADHFDPHRWSDDFTFFDAFVSHGSPPRVVRRIHVDFVIFEFQNRGTVCSCT